MISPLASDVRAVVRRLIPNADLTERPTLERLDQLFDEPLRIAIAGMVKSGKSTLLNALVGQRLAPTDAGECTKVVTWYGHGPRYEVTAVDHQGRRHPLRFERGAELVVDLDHHDPADLERLDVRWPSDRLNGQQLIDTPGLGSLSHDVSARTAAFLAGGAELPVDAVVYLLRHQHPADVAFLESFHGGVTGGGAMGAIGVLSRADELSGGSLDAFGSASRVARTLSQDPRLHRLVQAIVPVAGLLAETAATITNDELVALQSLGALDETARANTLMTADRVLRSEDLELSAEQRLALLDRFSLYGLRLAAQLLVEGSVHNADQLAAALMANSGIGELRAEIETRFASRAGTLRARAALGVLATFPAAQNDADVRREIERILAGAHELVELDLLDQLRRLELPGFDQDGLMRLLGSEGPAAHARLDVSMSASPNEIAAKAGDLLGMWRRHAEHPLAGADAVLAARAACRTCEGLLASR